MTHWLLVDISSLSYSKLNSPLVGAVCRFKAELCVLFKLQTRCAGLHICCFAMASAHSQTKPCMCTSRFFYINQPSAAGLHTAVLQYTAQVAMVLRSGCCCVGVRVGKDCSPCDGGGRLCEDVSSHCITAAPRVFGVTHDLQSQAIRPDHKQLSVLAGHHTRCEHQPAAPRTCRL